MAEINVNDKLPTVTKHITQEKIELFEDCGILDRQNIHNNPDIARERLKFDFPIASGRMSVTYASEIIRRFVGTDAFSHSGTVNLKFLKPVIQGDTVNVSGSVSSIENVTGGTLVTMNIECENQNGEKTAIGQGTAVIK
jgi:acyl dehydratase